MRSTFKLFGQGDEALINPPDVAWTNNVEAHSMADELDERELDLEEESSFYEDPMYDEDTYFAERLDNAKEDEDLDDEDMTTDEAEPASSTVISPDEQVDEFGESVKRTKMDEEAPLDYPDEERLEDD